MYFEPIKPVLKGNFSMDQRIEDNYTENVDYI